MTELSIFRKTLKETILLYGSIGTLKCSGSHDYDPATGTTLQGGASIPVSFAVVSSSTIVDQEPNRKAIQRDTGLDKLAEGRLLIFIDDGVAEVPSETGSITDPSGTKYTFSDLRPYIVAGGVVGYEATHRGIRDGL